MEPRIFTEKLSNQENPATQKECLVLNRQGTFPELVLNAPRLPGFEVRIALFLLQLLPQSNRKKHLVKLSRPSRHEQTVMGARRPRSTGPLFQELVVVNFVSNRPESDHRRAT